MSFLLVRIVEDLFRSASPEGRRVREARRTANEFKGHRLLTFMDAPPGMQGDPERLKAWFEKQPPCPCAHCTKARNEQKS
jgi:hypothetical protein